MCDCECNKITEVQVQSNDDLDVQYVHKTLHQTEKWVRRQTKGKLWAFIFHMGCVLVILQHLYLIKEMRTEKVSFTRRFRLP